MNKPDDNQALHSDLQGLVSDLKLSAVELMRIAVRLNDSGNKGDGQEVFRICMIMQAGEGLLTRYADEVKAGRIVRTKNE